MFTTEFINPIINRNNDSLPAKHTPLQTAESFTHTMALRMARRRRLEIVRHGGRFRRRSGAAHVSVYLCSLVALQTIVTNYQCTIHDTTMKLEVAKFPETAYSRDSSMFWRIHIISCISCIARVARFDTKTLIREWHEWHEQHEKTGAREAEPEVEQGK